MNETITNYEEMSTEKLKRKAETTFNNAEDESDYKKALEMYTELIRRDPTDSEYYYCCGYCFLQIGNDKKAIDAFNKAIELDPDQGEYYANRGDVYNEIGKHEEAVKDYSKAIELMPEEADIFACRGDALIEIGRYDDAIKDYTDAIYLEPENPDHYFNRGHCLSELEKYKEAIDDYNIAIELNSEEADYYCSYGAALYNLGRFGEAIVCFTKAIEFASDSDMDLVVVYLKNRGNAYRELGQFEKAYADYARGFEITPENSHLYFLRGFAKAAEGDFEAAYADTLKAIQLKPDESGYYDALGNVFRKFERYEDAVNYYTVAIDMDSECYEFYKNRAEAYTALGKMKEAEADNAKAAELKPANVSETENVKAKKTPKPKDINATAAEIIRVLKQKTARKSTEMKFMKQKTLLTDSKLGGVPFIPIGGEYPTDAETGDGLYLLVQINFAEMPPLPDYPTKGILQIFISSGDAYGCEYGDGQDGWRVLYYEDISHPMSKEDIISMMPEYPKGYRELPFKDPESEYRIKFCNGADMPISESDFRFDGKFAEYCDGILPDDLKGTGYFDLPSEIIEASEPLLISGNSRVGGYPYFAQQDPRGLYIPENYELLIQLDSDTDNRGQYAMMWSDCGVANFFIDPKDLKKRDFSKVIYTWEGC